MIVRRSEFARLCGVTIQSICHNIKKGTLKLTADDKIDTNELCNRTYFEKHLTKLKIEKGNRNDIFRGLEGLTELPQKVYTQRGCRALAACNALIKYIEEQERDYALQEKVVKKPAKKSAVSSLESIANMIVGSKLDFLTMHDGILDSLSEEYQIPYMNALGAARKKQKENGTFHKIDVY